MNDVAVAHDEIAVLEDEMRGAEHLRSVLVVVIDRDIGERAGAKMTAIRQPQQFGRRGAGHGGDFLQRIFARNRAQRRHGDRSGGEIGDPFLAEIPIHQKREISG